MGTKPLQPILLLLASVILALIATGIWITSINAASPIYVRPAGDDSLCNGEVDVDYSGGVAPNCAVQTIQTGVSRVDAGGTVEVAAGNYTETIIITQSLTLQGAQHGTIPTDPNGRPGGESIIRPSVSQPYTNNLITVITDNVTISGFMLDGNNPNLDSVDCTESSNGVCLHVAGGVANGNEDIRTGTYNFPYDINYLIVSRNIMKNLDYHGVALLRTGSVVAAGDNLISENLFYNLTGGTTGYARRRGIWLANSQYASIVDNKLLDVSDGILIGTFPVANPGAHAVISGNTIDCLLGCVKISNFFATSSPFSVISNTISGGNDGIYLSNLVTSLTITTTNNIISGTQIAVQLLRHSHAYVDANEIYYNGTGVYLTEESEMLSLANNIITTNTIGLLVGSSGGGGIVNSVFNNDFSGNTSAISNNTAAIIDASGNWWGDPAVPISPTVDYTPWLDSGMDTGMETGFQGDFSSLSVDDDSPQTGAIGRIHEGISLVDTSGTAHVLTGTYTETVNLDKDATLSMDGSITLSGDLAISQGTFRAPASDMYLTGGFSRTGGTFDNNSGAFILNGTSSQTIGGTVSTTFDDLTIDNGSGVTLGFEERVDGSLTFTNGRLNLDTHDLIMGPSSQVLGSISASNMVQADSSGRLCKEFDSIGPFTYPVGDDTGTAEYSPGTIGFTSGTFGASAQACMNVTDAAHPNNSASDYITRYWSVTSSDITNFSADVSFEYIDPADIVGIESIMYAAKYDSSVWTYGGAVDAPNNLLEMDGIDSFSDFTTASNPSSIMVVKDASFDSSQVFSYTTNIPGGESFGLVDDGTGTLDSQNFPNLSAGSYTITETVPTGWTLASVVCGGGSSTPIEDGVNVDLAPGENVTCTFNNQEQQGSLTIVKDASYESGQVFPFTSDIPDNPTFNLVDDGSGTNDSVTFNVDPGSYSVSETVPQNWTLESKDCTNGDTADDVTIDPGENVTCTFVNQAQSGSISIVKDTNYPSTQIFSFTSDISGGESFTLIDDGTGIGDSVNYTVDPGNYGILETVPPGWNLNSASCNNGDAPSDVTVEPAQSVTCTFINLAQNGSLTVIKDADYHSDQAFSFTSNIPDNATFELIDDGTGLLNSETFSIPPGTYTVSESVPSGWSLNSSTCNNDDPPASIEIDPGGSVICTFVNHAQPGSLTVVKDADYESSQAFSYTTDIPLNTSFDLIDDGTGANDSRTMNVDPGSFSITETVPLNWTLDSATCDNTDAPDDVNVGPGEDVTCTFVNLADPGSLTIAKDADYESSQAFSFTSDIPLNPNFDLIDDGTGANDSLTIGVVPGSYSVTETVPLNWTLDSATCDNMDTPDAVSIGPGGDVTCTFVNLADPGSLTIVKDADYESSQVFSFTSDIPLNPNFDLIDDGTGASDSLTIGVDPGNYSISETVPVSWTLDIATCDNSDAPDDVNVGPGEDVTCTFVNLADPGSLTIVKDADYESSQAFGFISDIPGNTSFDLIDDGTGANDSLTISVVPGSYSITETVPANWTLDSAACDNSDTPGDVNVGLGEDVTCTFVNLASSGSITVTKETVPDSSQSFLFGGDLGSFSLANGDSLFFSGQVPGSIVISETLPSGWVLLDVTCEGGDSSPIEDGVSVEMVPAGDITCTFINDFSNKIFMPFVTKPDVADISSISAPGRWSWLSIPQWRLGSAAVYYERLIVWIRDIL